MTSSPASDERTSKNNGLSKALGILFTVLGGVLAIGTAIYISHNGAYLWALVLVAWGVERVTRTANHSWRAAFLGLLFLALYAGLAAVVYYTQNGVYLWAIILVNWLGDAALDRLWE